MQKLDHRAEHIEKIIPDAIWFIWACCIAVAGLIAIDDFKHVQTPQVSMHHSQNEIDFRTDEKTKDVTAFYRNRKLYSHEKFELFMSLGRTQKWSMESAIVLLIFVLASQFLIVWYISKPSNRWLVFGLLMLIVTLWTWYQVTHWLETASVTFKSKTFGNPIAILGLPTIFFFYLAKLSKQTTPASKLLHLCLFEAGLITPWLLVWGFWQLVIGWVWI